MQIYVVYRGLTMQEQSDVDKNFTHLLTVRKLCLQQLVI